MADPYRVPGPLPDKGYHVLGAAIAAIVVSTVAVILRCVSRGLVKAGFWWDDWIILISLVKTTPSLLSLGALISGYSHSPGPLSAWQLAGCP